ncbi:hypothetical protein KXD40_002991 [Peronospora effusa]|uniref:Peptidyl-prolyl cis-trans isomerase n=1 Tax=Peronospora effusa TaxID=542832 RepID=A0A425CHE6_9STRA|nr:hypothetical protein DD237_003364 [Peronospora effusa]UIZ29574.1 hypothetical protein KXD40_002991 [Peronospora effusa]CAI5701808.1 unnamed protein product [Peronospora effusa]
MAPGVMAPGFLSTRKAVFLGMGVLLFTYLMVMNIFLDTPVQSPRLKHETKHLFQDQIGHAKEKMAAIPVNLRLWTLKKNRKYVWLDVAIDDVYVGRITAELYADQVPKTVENFRALTTGEKGPDYSFKGSVCHRIVKKFVVQCGDYTKGTGTGGRSIYDSKFDDEPNGLRLKHSKRYILQMANAGPNTNGSQFCFMLRAEPSLDGKHVVFGEVVEGFGVVDKMEDAGVKSDGMPLEHKVSFTDGGELFS